MGLKKSKSKLRWKRIKGALKQLDVGQDYVYGVNKRDRIYRRRVSASKGAWERVAGSLSYVSVGTKYVWGINRKHIVYARAIDHSQGWKTVDTGGVKFSVIEAGNGWVYGTDTKGNIFRREDDPFDNNLKWEKVSGGLKHISVGLKAIWGVNKNGNIYSRPADKGSKGSWTGVSGKLAQIDTTFLELFSSASVDDRPNERLSGFDSAEELQRTLRQDPACTCSCFASWGGPNCNLGKRFGFCKFSGRGHVRTIDGMRYNMYDTGEFKLWGRKAETNGTKEEYHLLTKRASRQYRAPVGLAIKISKSERIQMKTKQGRRAKTLKIRVGCEADLDTLLQSGKHPSGRRAYLTPGGARIWYARRNYFVRTPESSLLRIRTWRGHLYDSKTKQFKCRNCQWYMRVYTVVFQLRDGNSEGMCGNFDGNAGTDASTMVTSKGNWRPRRQLPETVLDSMRISDPLQSFFACSRKAQYAQGLLTKEKEWEEFQAEQKHPTKTLQEKVAERQDDASVDEVKGDKNNDNTDANAIDKDKAKSLCKNAKTADAKAACEEDVENSGDVAAVADAKDESSDDEANETDMKEQENEIVDAEEAQEKAAEEEKTGNFGISLQYRSRDDSRWNMLKDITLSKYGAKGEEWQQMTATIPPQADPRKRNVALRWSQADHSCECCDDWAISHVRVIAGGSSIAVTADQSFTIFVDGVEVGSGSNPEDVFKYAVNKNFNVVAVHARGQEGHMGILGQFGEDLVTSGAWRCLPEQPDPSTNWTLPAYDDSAWPFAMEQGNNGQKGLTWRIVNGISHDAQWIWSYGAHKEKGEAFCRIDRRKAARTGIGESGILHDKSSRWTCKSADGDHKSQPLATTVTQEFWTSAEIRSGKDEEVHSDVSATLHADVGG